MKMKFLAATLLALGALGVSANPASAWGDWFCSWGCGSGCCGRNVNVSITVPYNAFTPFCSGRSVTNHWGGYGCAGCGVNGYGGCGYGGGYGGGLGAASCVPVCGDSCGCTSDASKPGTANLASIDGLKATPVTAQNETIVPMQVPGTMPVGMMPMAGMPMQMGGMPMMPGYPMFQPVGYYPMNYPMNYGYYPMHPNHGAYGY